MIEDWHKSGRILNRLLRLRTSPVAVNVLRKGDEFPSEVKRPIKDFGFKMSICQGMGMARMFGWTVAMEPKENVCPPASILFGWSVPKDRMDFAKAWLRMESGADLKASIKNVEAMPRFKEGECRGLSFSPLESTKITPDLVLLYCDSAQTMNLIHACTFKEGGCLAFSSQARCACVESIIPTVLTKEPQIAIPCPGDRRYEMTQDDELIFAIPAKRIGDVILAIQTKCKRGYPLPPISRNLIFQPSLPAPYIQLEKRLRLQ